MVTMPSEFVATKFPGYFWNVVTRKLYSVKVTGELKELKDSYIGDLYYGYWRKRFPLQRGYRISHQGQRHWLDETSYLSKLKREDSVFPVAGVTTPVQGKLF
jgi:hypothetical protein